MGSIGKGIGKIAKKVAKPEILLPLALMAATGGMGGTALGAKMLGTAGATGTAASGALIPISKAAALSQGVATPGLLGFGGSFAPFKGLIGKGVMAGLKNPMSMKGLATYGGLGALAKNLTKDKVEGKDDKMNKQTQASYDMMRKMGEGMYSDEDINTYSAPYLSQMGGDYDKVTGGSGGGPDEGGYYEKLYPGLNYNLTRFVRPGQGWLTQPQKEPWNPYMAEGGRVGLAGGGKPYESWKDFIEPLFEIYPELIDMDNEAQVEFLTGKGMIRDDAFNTGGRVGYAEGDIVGDDPLSQRLYQEMYGIHPSLPSVDPYAETPTPDSFSDEMIEFSERTAEANRIAEEELMKKYKQLLNSEEMNKGGRVNYNLGGLGSIPQTPMVPQGQQLDGRGGGFIPMGAQEGKDDVPAMLANNEFVMTSDAVRAAGGGDINQGAQKMYDLMNSLEAKA